MLKNMRLVTAIVAILMLFGSLQILTGGLWFHSVSSDRDNFILTQQIRHEQNDITAIWVALIKTRNTLNRAGMHLQSATDSATRDKGRVMLEQAQRQLADAETAYDRYVAEVPAAIKSMPHVQGVIHHYQTYHEALAVLIGMLKAGDLNGFMQQPTQQIQDNFEQAYKAWLESTTGTLKDAVAQNDAARLQVIISLSGIALLSLLVIMLIGFGIRQGLIRPLRQLTQQIDTIASGDLTQRIEASGRNEMGQLMQSLALMQQALVRTVSDVRDGSDAIFTGVSEISAGNNDLSARTEEQAASLEQTAASMEQLTATVKQNAENARQASQLALSASETAQKGGKVVDDVVSTMKEIAGSSKKIADIISVIDGIAFQTNILALNAAVEAARAGEQGRGFAVVAGEVRSLAQRSAQAAKENKGLIEDSVSRVDTGSVLVGTAGDTMSDIVSAVTRVTDIMGEIASASDEQSRGIDQVGQAVTEMDRVTQQNASLVEESASAAASLEEQASRLSQSVAVFKIPRGQVLKAAAPLAKAPVLAAPRKALAAPAGDANWETF